MRVCAISSIGGLRPPAATQSATGPDEDAPQFCLRIKLLTLQHRVQMFMRVHDELKDLPLLEHEASGDEAHASPRSVQMR